jgi:sugar fermentation stimulation protein A
MRGVYLLVIYLKTTTLSVGGLGRRDFKEGYYIYVGSAMNSLEKRIERHLSKHKKQRWHIDYLLERAEKVDAFYKETEEKIECRVARELQKKLPSIEKFGSSDCPCDSHLFYSREYPYELLEDFSRFPTP